MRGNFKRSAGYRYQFHFPGLEFIQLPHIVQDFFFKDNEMSEFSKESSSWKIILELMIGKVVTSEVDALTYIVLSKDEKSAPYGELVGVTEFNCNCSFIRFP